MMQDTNFKLLRGFVTDGQTEEWTFVIVESILRLKMYKKVKESIA